MRQLLKPDNTSARYIPSGEDIKTLKVAAAQESVPRVPVSHVLLVPAFRRNTLMDRGIEMNIALISDDPNWNDTDLDEHGTWAEFRKGLKLTADGRGIVDFYIYSRYDPCWDLLGNISIEIADGRLSRVWGTGREYFEGFSPAPLHARNAPG